MFARAPVRRTSERASAAARACLGTTCAQTERTFALTFASYVETRAYLGSPRAEQPYILFTSLIQTHHKGPAVFQGQGTRDEGPGRQAGAGQT